MHGALGGTPPVEIVSTDPWVARMELVDHARSGRVFLIGDAAHLNPPFGGHGLNTGIGDAVDLGWKLAAVLQGWGGPGLLASYEAERRPLQRRVIDEATANGSVLSGRFVKDGLDETRSARPGAARRGGRRDPGHQGDGVLQPRPGARPPLPGLAGDTPDHRRNLRCGLGHRGGPGPQTPAPVVARRPVHPRPDRAGAEPDRPGRRRREFAGVGRRRPRHPSRRNGSRWKGAGRPVPSLSATRPSMLLVRPDQIVAWSGTTVPADPEALLRQITGRA